MVSDQNAALQMKFENWMKTEGSDNLHVMKITVSVFKLMALSVIIIPWTGPFVRLSWRQEKIHQRLVTFSSLSSHHKPQVA